MYIPFDLAIYLSLSLSCSWTCISAPKKKKCVSLFMTACEVGGEISKLIN